MTDIAHSTGITTQALYNWRSQGQNLGQIVPATIKPQEHCGAFDNLAALIQDVGLSGPDLGAFCRRADSKCVTGALA